MYRNRKTKKRHQHRRNGQFTGKCSSDKNLKGFAKTQQSVLKKEVKAWRWCTPVMQETV